MKDIYYVNSAGVKLDLLKTPYLLQTGEFFDYKWKYNSKSTSLYGGEITEYQKEIEERSMTLSILNYGKENYYAAIDRFYETVDYDVLKKRIGKLYFGESYLPCNVITSKKTDWESDSGIIDNTCTLVVPNPFWITEKQYTFIPGMSAEIDTDGRKRYDYTYDYIYPGEEGIAYINNDSIDLADFKMIVYGPRASVDIRIGDNIYNVDHIIQEREYMVIDTRDSAADEERVYLVQTNGKIKNLFHYRNPNYSIFEKIPPGVHEIDYGESGVDMTLFQRRSEPRWN